jgi:cobalt-zinc-cadmium efflux system outer membrane protein
MMMMLLLTMSANAPLPFFDEARGISLEEAIARGLEREPGLLAARSELDAAEGFVTQASLRPNPSVSLSWQEQIEGNDNSATAELEFPLELFRKGSRVAAAERALESVRYSIADRELALVYDIRTAYGNVASAARDLKVQDDLVAATRRSYELLRARVDEGAIPPLDRDRAEVELHRMESERLLLAGEAEAVLFELKRLLGSRPREEVLVSRTIDALVEAEGELERTADLSEAVAERPDVLEAEARLRLAEARIEEASDQGQLDMSLFGNYNRMDFSFPQMGVGPSGALEPIRDIFHSFTFGARLMLPLRNGNEGAIAAARAERAGAEALRRARSLAAESEAASALARDERSREAVAMYASSVRELARRNLEVVRESYELGRSSLSDVLIEQRRYLDSERGYTQALQAAFDARTALKLSLGDMK